MPAQIYFEKFADWNDVREEFSREGIWDQKAKIAASPVPKRVEKVIFASYTYEDYSGSALVVYFDQGKYWLNTGGHCSCHGLEDQWDPISYDSAADFKKCQTDTYGLMSDNKDRIFAAIDRFERQRKKPRQPRISKRATVH